MDKFELMRLLKRLRPISRSDERFIKRLQALLRGRDFPDFGNHIEEYVNKKIGQRWDGLIPLLESINEKQQQLNSCLEASRRSGPKRKRALSTQIWALKREINELWGRSNPLKPGRHKSRLRKFAENNPELDTPAKLREAFHKWLSGDKPLSRTESKRLIARCKATIQNIRRSLGIKKRGI